MATGATAASSETPETTPAATGTIVPDSAAKAQLRAVAKRAAEANTSGAAGYRIGPQDVIDITVFKVPDLSKTVQVSEAGTISYPLIGETAVSGKTAREVEQDVTRKLGDKYLQNPQVSVMVSGYNSSRVTIEGAVKKPGIVPLQGGMTLMQLVATAGGLTDVAENDAVILRQENGRQSAARFALGDIRAGNSPDPRLKPGDLVIVNTSATKQTFNTVLKALPLTRFLFMPF